MRDSVPNKRGVPTHAPPQAPEGALDGTLSARPCAGVRRAPSIWLKLPVSWRTAAEATRYGFWCWLLVARDLRNLLFAASVVPCHVSGKSFDAQESQPCALPPCQHVLATNTKRREIITRDRDQTMTGGGVSDAARASAHPAQSVSTAVHSPTATRTGHELVSPPEPTGGEVADPKAVTRASSPANASYYKSLCPPKCLLGSYLGRQRRVSRTPTRVPLQHTSEVLATQSTVFFARAST